MIFIIFDIEIVFLYPWAVVFRQLHTFGLIEVLVFAGSRVHLVPLPREQRRAGTRGPAKRLAPAMPERTTESTIAHVGPGQGPGAGQAA